MSMDRYSLIRNAPCRHVGASAPLLLDTYTGAAAAYSTRKIKAGVSSVMRVRRSSDSVEQDVSSEAEALAFAGANSGLVTTMYSQAGSTNAVQATATAQPAIVTSGVLNAGASLDGVNDALTANGCLVSTDVLVAYPGISFVAWVKLDVNTSQDIVAHRSTPTDTQLLILRHAVGTGFASLFRSSANSLSQATYSITISASRWYHVAGTFNFSTGAVITYVDGTPSATVTATISGTLASSVTAIGGSAGAANFLDGLVNDVLVYPSVLSGAQISGIYNATKTVFQP